MKDTSKQLTVGDWKKFQHDLAKEQRWRKIKFVAGMVLVFVLALAMMLVLSSRLG